MPAPFVARMEPPGYHETRLDVGQPDIAGPAVRAGLDVMTASVVAAIDLHITNAGCAFSPKVIFCRVVILDRHVDLVMLCKSSRIISS